jgi:5-formyltetrahydrofolate cyclo-ligase
MRTVPDQHIQKQALRRELRAVRSSIGKARRAALDESINRHLIEYARTARLSDIAAYLAFDGEPDLQPALERLEQERVNIALPVVRAHEGRNLLAFRQWTHGCELKPNRFGILEPVGTEEIPPSRFDVVLVPLVGWDRHGSRLGMGASFYDRAFQPFAENPRPMRMGVGYEAQCSDRIPLDPWDIPLHAMLTEKGWFTCTR